MGTSTPHHDEPRAHGGSKSRGTDPPGRRRVLMARVGEGIGLDLSPVIDALFEGEACDVRTVCPDSMTSDPRCSRRACSQTKRNERKVGGACNNVVAVDEYDMGRVSRNLLDV